MTPCGSRNFTKLPPNSVHTTLRFDAERALSFLKPDGVNTTLSFEVDGVHEATRLHVIRTSQRDVIVDVEAWCRMYAIWFPLRNVAQTG